MVPSTKTGIEITASVLISTKLSMNLPLFSPARTPALMPMTISNMTATAASFNVVGKAAATSEETCSPV